MIKRQRRRPTTMTKDEYRDILSRLGLSYPAAANALGISPRSAAGYALGDHIPAPTGKLLRLWLQLKSGAAARCPF
jgi:hypothetical protein